jgi:hypothetical protein
MAEGHVTQDFSQRTWRSQGFVYFRGGMQGEAGDPGQQRNAYSSVGGRMYKARALRPACGPMAMRYWMDAACRWTRLGPGYI